MKNESVIRNDITKQHAELIYKKQSEQGVKEQLHSFARENGFSNKSVEDAWYNTKHEMEENTFGEQHSVEFIQKMLNQIFDVG